MTGNEKNEAREATRTRTTNVKEFQAIVDQVGGTGSEPVWTGDEQWRKPMLKKKEKKLMNSMHYNQPVRTVKHTSATFHRLPGSSATGPDRLLKKGSSDSVGKITWSGRAFAVARVTRPRLNPEHPDSWCARKNRELLQSPDVTAGTRPSTHVQGWDRSHGASTKDWPTVGEDLSALNLTFQKLFPKNSCEKNKTAKQWRPWFHV